MHLHPEHAEKHFTASDTVRDVVVGMSDGLTVPFALAAGISGAIAVSHLVVTAGLAEIAAGSIAMVWADTWPAGANPSTTQANAAARNRRSRPCRMKKHGRSSGYSKATD